jgi:secondary thiamine-phosphate synthase enzyme
MIRRQITLEARPRGFHLITGEVVSALPELASVEVGLLHLMIRHTSASLTVNENASPEVRHDLRAWADQAVPEHFGWAHSLEGPDDMPAHVKGTLTGFELTLPLASGGLDLGTWQGIYLCEHRDHGGVRTITATILD